MAEVAPRSSNDALSLSSRHCGGRRKSKGRYAAQIRVQGYACDQLQSAERDVAASTANEVVWMLRCQNASYRVTLIPNMAAKVEKVGD